MPLKFRKSRSVSVPFNFSLTNSAEAYDLFMFSVINLPSSLMFLGFCRGSVDVINF